MKTPPTMINRTIPPNVEPTPIATLKKEEDCHMTMFFMKVKIDRKFCFISMYLFTLQWRVLNPRYSKPSLIYQSFLFKSWKNITV
jgi:hypothetical protein